MVVVMVIVVIINVIMTVINDDNWFLHNFWLVLEDWLVTLLILFIPVAVEGCHESLNFASLRFKESVTDVS